MVSLNHFIKSNISFFKTSAFGASKCIFSLPIPPETTCISPVLHCATSILYIPLLPVGNNAACQPKSLSSLNDLSVFCVASSIISTTPSIFLFEFTIPKFSNPRRTAIDERTNSGFRISPSISEVFNTSWINVSRLASSLKSKPSISTFPSNFPCNCLTSASKLINSSCFQKKFGHCSSWCMYSAIS